MCIKPYKFPYLSRLWLRLLGKLKGNVSRNLTHGWEIVAYRNNPLPPWPLAVKSFSYFFFLGLAGTQRLVLNFNVMVSSVNFLSYTSAILWIKLDFKEQCAALDIWVILYEILLSLWTSHSCDDGWKFLWLIYPHIFLLLIHFSQQRECSRSSIFI